MTPGFLLHICMSLTRDFLTYLRFCDTDACHCLRLRDTWVSATYMHVIDPRLLDIPAFLRHRCMSLTWDQLLVSWLYTSTLFLTNGPSWPPTAYNRPSTTPTPTVERNKCTIQSVFLELEQTIPETFICVKHKKSCNKPI